MCALPEGFAASLIRGLVTATLMLPSKYPRKVLASVQDACAWVAPLVVGPSGALVTPDDLSELSARGEQA